MSDLALSQADKNSALWRRLKKHMQAERDSHRRKNDSISLDERQTANLRGRIAQLNELLALDEEAPGIDT